MVEVLVTVCMPVLVTILALLLAATILTFIIRRITVLLVVVIVKATAKEIVVDNNNDNTSSTNGTSKSDTSQYTCKINDGSGSTVSNSTINPSVSTNSNTL